MSESGTVTHSMYRDVTELKALLRPDTAIIVGNMLSLQPFSA
jgi:hypothetical protein